MSNHAGPENIARHPERLMEWLDELIADKNMAKSAEDLCELAEITKEAIELIRTIGNNPPWRGYMIAINWLHDRKL